MLRTRWIQLHAFANLKIFLNATGWQAFCFNRQKYECVWNITAAEDTGVWIQSNVEEPETDRDFNELRSFQQALKKKKQFLYLGHIRRLND